MDPMFNNVDFGPLKKYLDDDDITDVSYSNNGQLWVKSLSRGIFKPEVQDVNNAIVEKLAFQCANMMGKTFNMAHPFLDAESAELRLNFVHDSIAKNGIALLMRKTPAKIRLKKEKILEEKYITETIHDFLLKCVEGHCNIIISGETGSGKTEFLKYLASHTKDEEKLITIEDTLELHLDKIFPHRDIIAMKTNNIASYTDVLVTCMRQNPKWILLSEVRSAEAVMAVRNSISSGHYILSTIHADKAESIPNRMYSLLETNLDIDQFLKSIYRYVQIGVHIRGYQDINTKRFVREVCEVCEFYVDTENNAKSNVIYRKTTTGQVYMKNPTKYLIDYLAAQGVVMEKDVIVKEGNEEQASNEETTTEPVVNEQVESIPQETVNSNVSTETEALKESDATVPESVIKTDTVVAPQSDAISSMETTQTAMQEQKETVDNNVPVENYRMPEPIVTTAEPVLQNQVISQEENLGQTIEIPVPQINAAVANNAFVSQNTTVPNQQQSVQVQEPIPQQTVSASIPLDAVQTVAEQGINQPINNIWKTNEDVLDL